MNDGRWHIPDAALDAWLHGTIGSTDAASVEQHLVSCTTCQGRTAGTTIDDLDFEEVWYDIVESTAGHHRSSLGRAAGRLGLTEADTIQLGATRGFRLAWLSGFVAMLVVTIMVSSWHPARALEGYLVIAPLIPLLGVSVGFGPHVDPTYELSLAAPHSAIRSVLLRTAVLLALSTPPISAAGALLEPWWVGPLATIPALVFVVATLAVATWRPPGQAAAVVSLVWVTAAAVAASLGDPLVLIRGAAMLVFAFLLVAGLATVALRRDQFSSPAFTV